MACWNAAFGVTWLVIPAGGGGTIPCFALVALLVLLPSTPCSALGSEGSWCGTNVSKLTGRELSGSAGSTSSSCVLWSLAVKMAGIEGIRNEGPGDAEEGSSISGGILYQLLDYLLHITLKMCNVLTEGIYSLARISTSCPDRSKPENINTLLIKYNDGDNQRTSYSSTAASHARMSAESSHTSSCVSCRLSSCNP